MMINQAAQGAGLFDGGTGTVLMIVGMVIAVAAVSGLGLIARMNDRSAERRAARVHPSDPPPPTESDVR